MFTKAKRSDSYIKLALTGPTGAGKTYSALRLAQGLSPEASIAVIDTENRSSRLYADRFNFDATDIQPPFTTDKFVNALDEAVNSGYQVVILDSASHLWEGILEYKNQLDKRGGNSFTNWNHANDYFKKALNSLLQSPIHVIACMRSKMDYVVEENSKGKSVPRKVGLAPIMRDGIEYEFTLVLDIDNSHQAKASKDRTGLFGEHIFQITEDTGDTIKSWLQESESQTYHHIDLIEELGQQVYEESWPDKKLELIQAVSKRQKSELNQLDEQEESRLLQGLKNLTTQVM